MKKIWIGFTLSIMLMMTIIIVSNTTLDQVEETYQPLSSLRTNYQMNKEEMIDLEGNLKVPFDIAFPDAFKSGEVSYDTTTILVKVLTKDLGAISLNMRNAGIASMTKLFGDNNVTWYEAKISSRLSIEVVMSNVRALDEILLADYNYTYQKESFSDLNPLYLNTDMNGIFDQLGVNNNPLASQQWYLDSFGIPEAWAWLTENGFQAGGSEDVVVAVVDTGVDFNHPDLKANMWVNPKEVRNGNDSDENGFTDDIHGATVISDWSYYQSEPMDDHGHGTHVAGIIAASNNKEGIIGIAHNVKIMAVKAGDRNGLFNASSIASGINYAYSNGADVINMSFGSGNLPSTAIQDALMLAYSTSVLVSSAGNNGVSNESCGGSNSSPNYPAALSYVIGVMSVGSSLQESAFSNWDCVANNNVEYEVNAPGEGMMSTLPNGQYVSWSGTSMAAPVVSAVAALVRSVYNDRNTYSNKFIMGQLTASSTQVATSLPGRPEHNIPFVIDAYKALASLPKPEITVVEYFIYDSVSLSDKNNGDGIIDAGETIEIGVVLSNRWGKSSETIITISEHASNQQQILNYTPKFEILNGMVNFGEVGTYSRKDLLTREDGMITGVLTPHVVKIDEDAPNNYVFRLNVSGSFKNGLDPNDETLYELNDTVIELTIRSGMALPNRITQDMTLTNDNLYILPNSTRIEAGVTVTVEPGTNIQFWSSDSNEPFEQNAIVFLEVRGRLIINGTEEEKVKIFPSDLRSQFDVYIYKFGQGFISISHAEIKNPRLTIDYLGHSLVDQEYEILTSRYLSSGEVYEQTVNPYIDVRNAEYNEFNGFRNSSFSGNFKYNEFNGNSESHFSGNYYYNQGTSFSGNFEYNKFNGFKNSGFSGNFEYNQFRQLISSSMYGYFYTNIFSESQISHSGTYENNVFLSNNYQGNSSGNIQIGNTKSILNNAQFLVDNKNGKTYIRLDDVQLQDIATVRVFAKELGGDLISIETEEEFQFVRSFINSKYIGLINDPITNEKTWINGSPYTLSIGFRYDYGNSGYAMLLSGWQDFLFPQHYYGGHGVVIEVPSNTFLNQILSNDQSINLDLESTYSLLQTLSVDPVTVDISDIVYETDDAFVATVDANGLITPHNYGVAYITAYSKDYQVSKTIQVNVLEKVELLNLKATLPNYQLSINETSKVDVSYTPTNTTQKLVTYSSSLPEVATINQQGIITARAVGETVITVSNSDGTIDSSFTISVVSPVVSVKFNEGIYITGLDAVDNNADFYPTITPLDATNQTLVWQSSNPEVAYVNAEGILVKLKEGVATLRATVANTTLFDELIVSVSSNSEQLKVKKLFHYDNYFFALLDNSDILIWGNDLSSSKKITNNTGFNIIDMERFGDRHFIILTEDFKAKIAYIDNNQIYLTSYNSINNDMLDRITDVKSIHANMEEYSVFILTNSGDVWAFGRNYYGQLGDGTTIDRWSNLVQVSIENVKDIKTSTYSVIFLTNDNKAYITGTWNQYSTPTKVFDDVEFISNQRGSVGIHTSSQVHFYPSGDTGSSAFDRIANSSMHYSNNGALFYIKDGLLFSKWNQNNGQLGLGTQSQYYSEFTQVEGLTGVENIFLFDNNTFIQTESGFYGVGRNSSNELITYDNIPRYKPYPIVFGLKGNTEVLSFESNLNDRDVPFTSNEGNWLLGSGTSSIVHGTKQSVISYENINSWQNYIYINIFPEEYNLESTFDLKFTGSQGLQYRVYLESANTGSQERYIEGTGSLQTTTFNTPTNGFFQIWITINTNQNNASGSLVIENFNFEYKNSSVFYGESIVLDYNEAIVSSSAYGNISLIDTETGGLVSIRRSILLDKFTITPTRALRVGTVYQLVIPSGALSSKFMVSNQIYTARFEYLGTYDPSLLPENQQAFLEEAKEIETVSTIINSVNVQYVNQSYRLTMNVIDSSLPTGVFDLLQTLGVSEVSFDSGKTYISVSYLNASRFIEIIRAAILSSSDHSITMSYKAKIALEGYEQFTADFNVVFNFDTNTTVYSDLVDQALNMEMRLLELSHEDGSSRHLANKEISLTFNNAKASDRFDDIVLKDRNNEVVPAFVTLVNNVLTIEAFVPLKQGNTYTYDVPFGALVDDLGNFNQRYLHTFKVYEPIKLIRSSIALDEVNVSQTQEFRFFYNFAVVNDLSLITLKDSKDNSVQMNVSLVNHILYIKPVSLISSNETYTLTIPNGILKDELNAFNQALTYTFDTIEKVSRFQYTQEYLDKALETLIEEGKYGDGKFINNAVLNVQTDSNLNLWLRFQAEGNTEDEIYLNQYGIHGNYFGTDNQTIIDRHFIDFDQFQSYIDINPGEVVEAPSTTFPFVVDVKIYDQNGEQHYSYGNQLVKFVVRFNRDMETSVPLHFSFGSSWPYAEFRVEGEYKDARTWEGTYELRSVIGSGSQFVNITNGHAKDLPFLELGLDLKRFTFSYDTAEAQALTLQGSVDEKGILITWVQDDFDTIAGYNVYRRLVNEGSFTRLNSSIIPHTMSSLLDSDIEAGKLYEYYFTVVLTDFDLITGAFKESDSSGQILIRALDTILPNIYHTPSFQAHAARNVIISATIVDNIAVSEASVYFRTVGETTYTKIPMTHLNSRYNGIISAMFVKTEGLEYYIEAFDGLNYQYFGTADIPVQVQVIELVNSNAKGDVNADGVVDVIDALMILRAINGFITLTNDEMQRADLNGDGNLSSSEALVILQYAIGKRTTLNM